MCIFVHPIRKSPTHNKIEIKTDTIIIRDTIVVEDMKPITEIKYKDKFITDTVFVDNTPIVADIPFEEKTYSDSNYYIKISGFEPNIDELKIYQKEKVITNTITKYKKWNYGITGGLGYGLTSNKVDCWVGIGITYSF